MRSQKNAHTMTSSIITKICRWNTRCISSSAPIYPRKKNESKLFMVITIELSMIQADSDKKCGNHDNQSRSCQREVIEKLIRSMYKWLLDIENSSEIDYTFDDKCSIENILMDTIEYHHEDEIDEGECEHILTIGIILRNSRGIWLLRPLQNLPSCHPEVRRICPIASSEHIPLCYDGSKWQKWNFPEYCRGLYYQSLKTQRISSVTDIDRRCCIGFFSGWLRRDGWWGFSRKSSTVSIVAICSCLLNLQKLGWYAVVLSWSLSAGSHVEIESVSWSLQS